jgi:GGDEF domain-containing protein
LAALAGRACRLGGDEFCLLIEADADDAGELVDRARVAVSADVAGFEVRASAGMGLIPVEAEVVSAALRLADERMDRSKARGRGLIERHAPGMLLRPPQAPDATAGEPAATPDRAAAALGLR